MNALLVDLQTALDASRLMAAAGMQPDLWQADLLREKPRQAILCCCRQSGKSVTAAMLALHEAIYHENGLILLLSPSLRQSSELFRKVLDLYTAIGRPTKATNESTLRIEFQNGSRIISLPGTEATIRGYSGARLLVIDEASRVEDPLYYSVRPMLAVSGGRLVALSTPFGKCGWFFETWQSDSHEWTRVRITAPDCPRISKEFLEQERRSMPARWFQQEYECEFHNIEDAAFASDRLDAAIDPTVEVWAL